MRDISTKSKLFRKKKVEQIHKKTVFICIFLCLVLYGVGSYTGVFSLILGNGALLIRKVAMWRKHFTGTNGIKISDTQPELTDEDDLAPIGGQMKSPMVKIQHQKNKSNNVIVSADTIILNKEHQLFATQIPMSTIRRADRTSVMPNQDTELKGFPPPESTTTTVNSIPLRLIPVPGFFQYQQQQQSSTNNNNNQISSSTNAAVPMNNNNNDAIVKLPPPDLSQQKAPHEKDNLKLHMCNSRHEAYSAAWLTTTKHFLASNSTKVKLSRANLEMASAVYMRNSNNFYRNAHGRGLIMQTLDVLDFSSIFLSNFEKVQQRYADDLWPEIDEKDLKSQWTNIQPIELLTSKLQSRIHTLQIEGKLSRSRDAQKTIVLIPFLGAENRNDPIEIANSYVYLAACIWSHFEHFPNILVTVANKADFTWLQTSTGLPIMDLILLDTIPKRSSLPVATTQLATMKFQSGVWKYRFVLYTEPNQIVNLRIAPYLYDYLRKYNNHVISPHRLNPYPKTVINDALHKLEAINGGANTKSDEDNLLPWQTYSCCLLRQNCLSRRYWVDIKEDDVEILDYLGVVVPLGNSNFKEQRYRPCTLSHTILAYCP